MHDQVHLTQPPIKDLAAATFAKRATPSVDASARCAVPNASITNTSQSAAYFAASSGLFFFSPALKRQFYKDTT